MCIEPHPAEPSARPPEGSVGIGGHRRGAAGETSSLGGAPGGRQRGPLDETGYTPADKLDATLRLERDREIERGKEKVVIYIQEQLSEFLPKLTY
jgi:hypothetical protein